MPRAFLVLPGLFILTLPALPASEPVPLPKDTLPGVLSVEAVPLGLAARRATPADNPLTEGKVRLGRKLKTHQCSPEGDPSVGREWH